MSRDSTRVATPTVNGHCLFLCASQDQHLGQTVAFFGGGGGRSTKQTDNCLSLSHKIQRESRKCKRKSWVKEEIIAPSAYCLMGATAESKVRGGGGAGQQQRAAVGLLQGSHMAAGKQSLSLLHKLHFCISALQGLSAAFFFLFFFLRGF